MPAVPIIAAVSGAATAVGAAVASTIGFATISSVAATAIGTGIIAGGMTAIQGGDASDVLESAVIGGVTSYVGSAVSGAVGNAVAEATGSQIAGSIAGSAAGTLATGGDSEDVLTSGLLAGIGAGIDEAKLAAADEYLNSIPVEAYDTATLPTELDVIAAFPELAPPPVFDTTFTPDYSLSTGAPIVPEMGAQGIQVPTITELVDVVNQPVDYSLPIPSSSLGLQMPMVPNLGDPESFINQPAPNVEVNIPQLTETAPANIDTELALLDLAKAAAPYAVGALVADEVINQPEQPSGFPILPVPADWRSPEYNMAFTPSEAIDFGNLGMLAGTQFARQPVAQIQQPMDVSTLINALNLQQAEPLPQFGMDQIVGNINDVPMSINDIINSLGQPVQPFGMNQTIGQLNNAPASLNSIIAGIQSQYG